MKILKKIAIMAVILVLSVALNVYAGETIVDMKSSKTEVKAGETVTITVSGKSGTGIEGVDSTLTYDKTKLKLTNEDQLAASGFTSLSGIDEKTGEFKLSIVYTGTGNAPQEADFAKLNFEVLSGVKANETLEIGLSKIQLGGSDEQWENLTDKKVTLKVIEDKPTNPGDGDQKPGDGDQKPGDGDQKPGDYPYAGPEKYIFVALSIIAIVSTIVYIKFNKYKDIK